MTGTVFRAAGANQTGSTKGWERESKTKGGKTIKKQGARREKQSAERSYKEQAGITLRDNSTLALRGY